MARVDYTDVLELLGGTSSLDSGMLTALIDDAAAWVDTYLVGRGMSDTVLAVIEKNIAAHLAVMAGESGGGQLIAATRADISERYGERKGDDAAETTYIRTAAAFDRTGLVAEHWLGKKRVQWYVGRGYASKR